MTTHLLNVDWRLDLRHTALQVFLESRLIDRLSDGPGHFAIANGKNRRLLQKSTSIAKALSEHRLSTDSHSV